MRYKDLPVGTSFNAGFYVKTPGGHFTSKGFSDTMGVGGLHTSYHVNPTLLPAKLCVPEEFFE